MVQAATTPARGQRLSTPTAPESVAETGLDPQFLLRLVLKSVYVTNFETAPDLAEYMKLSGLVVHEVLEEAREKRLVEVLGLTEARGSVYRYSLTSVGREWAVEALGVCQYTGPAPVTLEAFRAQVAAQSITTDQITPESMARALSHLVLPEGTIARLGPAANSARALLLYGAPGNGKTSIALALGQAFDHAIHLPYCIEADGQIIRFFDPAVHHAWEGETPRSLGDPDPDERWVLCQRPVVVTGGELNIEMLDLSFDPLSKTYEAPAHMKASGGVFIADDLGRQRVAPHALINRWIMPLERRVDYLTLHTGKKIEIPFDQLVVFSTNSPPQEMIDAAGMRRIPYKFHVPVPTNAEYMQILKDVCASFDLDLPDTVPAYLLDEFYPKTSVPISAVHPRFIIDHVIERCRFEAKEPHVTLDLIHDAVENLMVDGEPPPVPAAA